MPFTELNSVEHFIVQQLTGVNLNEQKQVTMRTHLSGYAWDYLPADLLDREITEVMVESDVKDALIRLNPEIAMHPDRADEVIYKLRAILISVGNVGLVKCNEEFAKWLKGDMTMPFGKNGEHVPVNLIDFEHLANNRYLCVNQWKMRIRETKIPDIALLINGIPVVIGEAKTPVRPAVTWFDGAYDIHQVYENAVPNLFVPNILNFATDGRDFFYGAVRTPLEFWCPWRLDETNTTMSLFSGLVEVGKQLTSLLRPEALLDILQHFSVYATNTAKRKIKVVCRYQQYEGANAIVNRVVEGHIKKGLVWHFQGSGKSLLMLFAAQKMRRLAALKSPTIIIVVDRVDLDTQISNTFNAAEVPNLINANSIKELLDFIERDTRKIIVTLIHKFKEATPDMNLRDNIIVMVDEAHRTQEGDLGRKMRSALPNAFLFGMTGTPINRSDKNTFWAFGAPEDANGYLSRYTFQESIRDLQTLPLHFEPRLPNVHIEKENLDIAFREMAGELSDDDRNKLSQKAAKMLVFLKAPERIEAIVSDIATHFRTHVLPSGFKAMIVTPDRLACVLYKEALDRYFTSESSAVVISTNANDPLEFKQKWALDKDQQEKVLEQFNTTTSPLKFLIVTAKLLAGFDAPLLQTMYLDKSLKDHTLLQAICRTNRVFPNKTFGRIVDYFGVFDDTAKALEFDEATVRTVISNLQELRDQLPALIETAVSHFPGVDRTIDGFEGLSLAQDCINTNEKRDAFAKDFVTLSKVWEALSPDPILNQYQRDYKWLSQIYASVRPASDDTGRLLWHAFGAQTEKLIHEHIHVDGVNDEMEEMILDAQVIDELMNGQNPNQAKKLVLVLVGRLGKHPGNPKFKRLSERLEELRNRAERGLISSIDFIKHLCQIARDTLEVERETFSLEERRSAKTALTELFLEMKTDKTPAVVERIVNDIDEIVKIVRFDGWQSTVAGEREVQKSLRKTLLKYQLHKEEELFEKAYAYIKEYY